VRTRPTDLDSLGAQRTRRAIGVAQGDASVGLDAFDLADDVSAATVALESNGLSGSEPETGQCRR
jgi:hypothetical protein